MCKDCERLAKAAEERAYHSSSNQANTLQYTTQELKNKRECLLQQLVVVQKAIDAVNLADNI